jgi:tetratricopeptide (TPR) repeat protein
MNTILRTASDTSQVLSAAVQQHRSGDLKNAEQMYRSILDEKPRHPDALHLLGVLAHQTGRVSLAVQSIQKAIQLGQQNAMYSYNLGAALKDAGQFEQAIEAYRRALEMDPQLVDAWLNLGALYQQAARLDEAVECYQKAIEIRPDYAAAHSNLGAVCQQGDRLHEAAKHYRRAIELNPQFAQACCNLGGVLRRLHQRDEAISWYLRALEIEPNYMPAHHNLAQALHQQGRYEDALRHNEQALRLKPNSYETHVNLGSLLQDMEKYDFALMSYENALRIRPEGFEAYNNQGRVLQEQGRFDEALNAFDVALRIAPRDADSHFNRGLVLIQQGRYQQGWEEYDWRFQTGEFGGARPLGQPLWDGSPLAGKSIMIHAEQGLGDEIMFASGYRHMLALADQCVLTCDRRLTSLLARSFPSAHIIGVHRGNESWDDLSREQVDYQIPAGSTMRYLRTRTSDFPRDDHYLVADPQQVQRWRERLGELGPGLKIGISWRAGCKPPEINKRSIPLRQWAPLLSLPGIHFINLQYGECEADLVRVKQQLGVDIHDWDEAAPLYDVDGMAAQLSALDLVISVGNATVHLAGSLGVPTWNLLPAHWGWRWGIQQMDNPWYARVQSIRQDSSGDWEGVMSRVVEELQSRLTASDSLM